jgi:hypothetical protein
MTPEELIAVAETIRHGDELLDRAAEVGRSIVERVERVLRDRPDPEPPGRGPTRRRSELSLRSDSACARLDCRPTRTGAVEMTTAPTRLTPLLSGTAANTTRPAGSSP